MAPGARQIQSIQHAGIEAEIIDMRGIPKVKYLQVLPRIRQAVKKVDLIHAHFGYCGWLALLGCKLAWRRVPIVMSFMGDDLLGSPYNEHGDLERFSVIAAHWNRSLASSYDQVICKSQEMADRILPVVAHVVPNGVDFSVFCPLDSIASSEQIGISPTKLKVLFPGNPENPRKGHGLAKAAVEVAKSILRADIELIPLWGVKPDQVALYMNACNAMLMTSQIEGSPNVVKEALACNQCVVGVPVGDVHQLLNGVEGCQATSRDPEEIGLALATILKAGRRSNGREVMQQRGLSLESVAKQIISIYELALGTRSVSFQSPAVATAAR
jgi:glycosyltransferase involved in cell wall biosynthesis